LARRRPSSKSKNFNAHLQSAAVRGEHASHQSILPGARTRLQGPQPPPVRERRRSSRVRDREERSEEDQRPITPLACRDSYRGRENRSRTYRSPRWIARSSSASSSRIPRSTFSVIRIEKNALRRAAEGSRNRKGDEQGRLWLAKLDAEAKFPTAACKRSELRYSGNATSASCSRLARWAEHRLLTDCLGNEAG
jgi:hypothetical protein